ncbi:high-affinity nicotinic acid transporter [Hypoxylon fragiforme]|uniref:high-affinity nicotinic acid transporter n=1 Tax=Hypoxylon fragiforme TaxID=63214 RepID=UPI0020C6014F|nr:high-affinity nicotinic acid transporter [Hypoxylon fragiforme]KAI2605093.1 high-affinity nicotinic acid transporter [Hypoxylon fragiforme]
MPKAPVTLCDDENVRSNFLASFTAKEADAIMKKVDNRFLVLIGLMYMIKQIDVNNAANVKVLQVGEPTNILTELNMSTNQYNWVQSIYGIAYILFETPSNLVLKRMSPHVWQARIFFCWGIIVACHAAVQNRHALYALRFLLGMFEAGMFPGVIAQLAAWYRTDEMGRPVAWFFTIQNTSNIVGSLLCYGISYMNGVGGLSAWRWVYLIEGIITIFFAGAVFTILPDYPKSPRSNAWLTPREQEFIEVRLPENAPLTSDPFFSAKEIVASLRSPLIWSFMLSQMLVNFGNYALTWYLPTIVTNLGFTALPKNQLLNIPPAAAAIGGLIFSSWFLGKAYIVRPLYIMFIMTGMVVCFVLFFTLDSRIGIYIACILGTTFTSSYFIPFWAWRTATLRGSTGSAFTLGFQNAIGQVGTVTAPQLFQQKWAYSGYKQSFAIAAAGTVAAFFANLWTWWLTRNTEYDVMRVRRLIRQAKKEGKVFHGDDVKVFEERGFFDGLRKRSDVEVAVV